MFDVSKVGRESVTGLHASGAQARSMMTINARVRMAVYSVGAIATAVRRVTNRRARIQFRPARRSTELFLISTPTVFLPTETRMATKLKPERPDPARPGVMLPAQEVVRDVHGYLVRVTRLGLYIRKAGTRL